MVGTGIAAVVRNEEPSCLFVSPRKSRFTIGPLAEKTPEKLLTNQFVVVRQG